MVLATQNKNQKTLAKAPPPELIARMLDTQQRELEVRTQELALQGQQAQNHKSIAEASIKANLEDRKGDREFFLKRGRHFLFFFSFLALILLVFASYLINSGNADIVMKMIEFIVPLSAGFACGYGFKATRCQKEDAPDS